MVDLRCRQFLGQLKFLCDGYSRLEGVLDHTAPRLAGHDRLDQADWNATHVARVVRVDQARDPLREMNHVTTMPTTKPIGPVKKTPYMPHKLLVG